MVLIFIFALVALAVAGCSTTSTPSTSPTDTTPGTLPTQTPPATPTATSWLSGYTEVENGAMTQEPMVNQVVCQFDVYYHNSDWTLPDALRTLNGSAHHGIIYKLRFTNPTSSEQTIVAGDSLKSIIRYRYGDEQGYLATSEIFYDPDSNREYGTITLPGGAAVDVYMLAYITSNADYSKYGSGITTVSLDLNPRYYEQFY